MTSKAFLGLVIPYFAYFGIEPRQARSVEIADMVRGTPQGNRGIDAWNHLAVDDQFPYSEAPLSSAEGAQDFMRLVPESGRKCFHLRYTLLEDGHTELDIGKAYLDHDFGGPATVSISSSHSQIDSSRIGWNREGSSQIGGTISASLSSNLLGLVSAGSAWTVSGSHKWGSGESGDLTKTQEETKTVAYQVTCPEDSSCKVVTWTYIKTTRGRCGRIPLVEPDCVMRSHSGWPKTSVVALASLEGPYNRAYSPWAVPIAKHYWHIPAYWPPHSLPEKNGLIMHHDHPDLINKYEAPCSFSYPLYTSGGKPVSTQDMLIYRRGYDNSPPPTPNGRFTAIGWNYEENVCELENDWTYTVSREGAFYGRVEPKEWFLQKRRPNWPLFPDGLYDKCRFLGDAVDNITKALFKRSDDDDDSDEYLDKVVVLRDDLGKL
ncbi:hypothetical protein CP533_3170 [Ophiocordyceps camponoti-saundersi (nom. inval.)]|nr:hypothetical protein CP533_3170 [Ophiocordyceps camponoti-saundersi (nom. inval.)]